MSIGADQPWGKGLSVFVNDRDSPGACGYSWRICEKKQQDIALKDTVLMQNK